MKTKNLLVALSVAMLSTWSAYAQKVESLSEDGPVISCEGMPSEAYTITTKGNVQGESLSSKTGNAKLYHRFAVSKVDNHAGQSWAEAFDTCSNLGGKWRLPTQRELMLICVLKRELQGKPDFKAFADYFYWTATDNDSTGNFYVSFSDGASDVRDKVIGSFSYKVRCIKEL